MYLIIFLLYLRVIAEMKSRTVVGAGVVSGNVDGDSCDEKSGDTCSSDECSDRSYKHCSDCSDCSDCNHSVDDNDYNDCADGNDSDTEVGCVTTSKLGATDKFIGKDIFIICNQI